MTIRVFFPIHCLELPPGVIVGYYKPRINCYYVVNIVENYVAKRLEQYPTEKPECQELGIWCTSARNLESVNSAAKQNQWIVIYHYNSKLDLYLLQSKSNHDGPCPNTIYDTGIIYLYQRKVILSGCAITSWTLGNDDDAPLDITEENKLHESNTIGKIPGDSELVKLLYGALFHYQVTLMHLLENCTKSNFLQHGFDITSLVLLSLLNYLINALKSSVRLIQKMHKPLLFLIYPCQKVISLSSLGSHCILKSKLLNQITLSQQTKDNFNLRKSNLAAAFMLDLLLGLLIYYWFSMLDYNAWDYALEAVTLSVEFIGQEVKLLIKWLMGIPIGLKLNSPLNHFLGKFFLHHVQLWLEYIKLILETLSSQSSNFFMWPLYVSCCGLSFFLAFISDMISLLTFHTYCFYVYAARLYGLQVTALMSLWRLFRGKKWNPLRKRVDTLHQLPDIGNHRFFAGTLLFTILLFLLPTTALYYTIFTLLRIVTMTIQNTLFWMQQMLCYFPWCTAIVRTFNRYGFPQAARFDKISEVCANKDNTFLEQDKPLQVSFSDGVANVGKAIDKVEVLEVHLQHQSYCKAVVQSFNDLNMSHSRKFNIHDFLVSLLNGKLLTWS
ncbi:uncharacterized protein LOC143462585 [Clavelina lepadiformis]|uniref:uncharacterized protein LOC143462585 n=1 Tax=Clavelina lepadiformis TaxID=159417 RepID=UPI0040427E13